MEWGKVKDIIKHYTSKKNDWTVRYKRLLNNFEISEQELEKIILKEEDSRVKELAQKNLNILKNYTYRKDFANVITVKLVIPSGCNAQCQFCYMKSYEKMCYDKELFLNNFLDSLTEVIVGIDGRQPISLDITGNEPTFDKQLLKTVLIKLRSYPLLNKICRVTLTSNGMNLEELIPYMKGVVNYVNISVHDFRIEKRKEIFGIEKVLSYEDYRRIVLELLNNGIDSSAICVLYKDVYDFNYFRDTFISWCKEIGFQSIRFRNDVFWKESKFDTYMAQAIKDFNVIQEEHTNDSNWCRLSDDEGFFIFFLNGVVDTSIVSKGIEYVINDDGKCYVDFYKRTLLKDYDFPIGLIFDKK